jgi:hypothetical protein
MILSFTQDASLYKGLNQVIDYHVSGYHSVPMPDYDKTYYFFDEKARQIVACRILKVVVGSLNSYTQNFFLIKTPNGMRKVQEDRYKFFASVLDCQMSMSGQASSCSFKEMTLKQLFPEHIVCYTRTWFSPRHCCYAFKDGHVQEVTTYIRYMVFDRYGCTICFFDKDDKHGKIYLDRDECLRENTAGISVVEFEDEKEPEPEPLMDTTNNHDAELVQKINHCYDIRRNEFCQIVALLCQRDNADYPKEWNITKKCREYCRNIADDKDLRTILSYCGW